MKENQGFFRVGKAPRGGFDRKIVAKLWRSAS
jgi:hypothetical protein